MEFRVAFKLVDVIPVSKAHKVWNDFWQLKAL